MANTSITKIRSIAPPLNLFVEVFMLIKQLIRADPFAFKSILQGRRVPNGKSASVKSGAQAGQTAEKPILTIHGITILERFRRVPTALNQRRHVREDFGKQRGDAFP